MDKRDEVLQIMLSYGIKECEWCDIRKGDLTDCAEEIIKVIINK